VQFGRSMAYMQKSHDMSLPEEFKLANQNKKIHKRTVKRRENVLGRSMA
jgi:hypothetical protein